MISSMVTKLPQSTRLELQENPQRWWWCYLLRSLWRTFWHILVKLNVLDILGASRLLGYVLPGSSRDSITVLSAGWNTRGSLDAHH